MADPERGVPAGRRLAALRRLHGCETDQTNQARPGGAFTTAEAARLGIDTATLSQWVREGHLTRPLRGVYMTTGTPLGPRERAALLGLVVGDDRIVSGDAAAWLWGVMTPPEATILHPTSQRPQPRVRAVEHFGVRVIDPLATLDHLTSQAEADEATTLAAMDTFLASGYLGHAELLEHYGTDPTRRRIAAFADGRASGWAEAFLRLQWLATDLPTPVPGYSAGTHRLALATVPQRFAVTTESIASPPRWRVVTFDPAGLRRADPGAVRFHLRREYHHHRLRDVC